MNNKLNFDLMTYHDSETALKDLLVDPGMLFSIENCKTEVGKIALEIHKKFEETPENVSIFDMEKLVTSTGSQINKPKPYFNHIINTGSLFFDLVSILSKIHSNLDLPHPNVAYSTGLVHDINGVYSDYSKGGGVSKEIDSFILSKRMGFDRMANTAAFHNEYIEIMKQLKDGAKLTNPNHEVNYIGMRKILKGDGPLSYNTTYKKFKPFLEGKDNLPLILLTVCDNIENGKSEFCSNSLKSDFKDRIDDILKRYYYDPINNNKTPSLFGQALMQGGVERISSYVDLTSKLLKNNPQDIEHIKNTTNFFN